MSPPAITRPASHGGHPGRRGTRCLASARATGILAPAGAAALCLAALTLAACSGSASSHPAAGPGKKPGATVTVTAPPATTTTPPATVTVTAPASVPAAPTATTTHRPHADQVIARFNGTGDKNTPPFTVPASWHLSWAYWGCPNPPDNFIVTEMNTDGSSDLNGISINELGSGRGPVATYAYGDAGQHYFSVNTEGCSWSLAIVTGP